MARTPLSFVIVHAIFHLLFTFKTLDVEPVLTLPEVRCVEAFGVCYVTTVLPVLALLCLAGTPSDVRHHNTAEKTTQPPQHIPH